MSRKLVPYDPCQRRYLSTKLKAEIMLRQDGRCADCGTRLILGFFVFDHRPPLALRDQAENANDPERLAAICWTCNEQKTPKDLKEIAKTKRMAEKHQAFVARQAQKLPGRRLPTPTEERWLEQEMERIRRNLPPWFQPSAGQRELPPPSSSSVPRLRSAKASRSRPGLSGGSSFKPAPLLPKPVSQTPRLSRPAGLPPLLPKPKR